MSNTDDIGFLGVTVESVEFIDLDEPSPVFDIEVETDHSFIVSGVVAHNCTTCAPLDGLEWTKERQAIGHKFPYPNYPLHFRCRCLLIAVVLDGPQGGTRASADGQIPANQTFDDWLDRQSTEKQNEILGKGRATLYRDGKITLSDLVRGNGSPLTLNQLRSKYS